MTITNRPTLVGALVGALALGAGTGVAAAQQTQDTSRTSQTGQTTEMPPMPGQGGAADTAGYSGMERQRANPSSQDTSQAARTGAGQDTSQAAVPPMPQQGGPADTAGYTKFKREMGKAGDTISPAGKTTNYRQKKQYPAKPSVSDSTGGQARTQDTSATGAKPKSKSHKKKSKTHPDTTTSGQAGAASDTGAVGRRQHKSGMTHDSLRTKRDSM